MGLGGLIWAYELTPSNGSSSNLLVVVVLLLQNIFISVD
jgi:hypothetical protein